MKSEQDAIDANSWMEAEMKAQGFNVSGMELRRLAGVLNGIASDLAKLDALKGLECNSTPCFRVEEGE